MKNNHHATLRFYGFLLLVAFSTSAFAQTQDERAVRAAYVFHITKLVDWPPEKVSLQIGFLGNRDTGEFLQRILEGRISDSRPIHISLLPSDGELQQCSIVYFGDSQSKKVHAALAKLDEKNILTIGEADSFARDGGMIGLVKVGQQIRIQVNQDAARRAGVKISPRLFDLAEVVRPASPLTNQTERKIVQRRDPEYPALAASMSLHGTVKVKAHVAPEGSVRSAECTGGHPLLAQAALKSVETWKFEPAPKETIELIEIEF